MRFFYKTRYVKKLILPNSLTETTGAIDGSGDSLIWTSSINIQIGTKDFGYISLPEGVNKITDIPNNVQIVFPNSLKDVCYTKTGISANLKIYSFIEAPENITAKYEWYDRNFAAIKNSIFYIPKGTKDRYLNSDFATLGAFNQENNGSMPNGNVFIEYYDIDRTEVNSPEILYKGESANLEVQIYPDANLVSWIDYSTSNPDIVSVDSEGKIVANGYGQVEISATPHVFIDGLETKTGTCVVKVIAHTEGIEMASAMSVHIGEDIALNAKTLPLDMSDGKITYKSSDPSIANVNSDGIVNGNKRGTCTITATSVDGGYTAECLVTVTQPVEALALEKHSLSLKVGETETIYAQIAPTTADDKTLNWCSKNEEVATVDVNGTVNALKSGEAWIVAVSNDNAEVKDSCKVTVTQPVTGITLNHSTYQLNKIGDFIELEATVLPEGASNKNVRWMSSNENICVVLQGMVVAIRDGTCVIIATTEDGGFMATCVVTVPAATGVSSMEMDESDLFQIYDVHGTKRSHFQRGINIIQFMDGTKKKVLVK